VPGRDRGIIIASCIQRSGAAVALRPEDVILKWDDREVDNLGFYMDPDFGRLSFAYLIKGRRKPGDVVPARIVRDGRLQDVQVCLARFSDDDSFVPENTIARKAEYLVEGGLVIRELTGRYLRAHGSDWERVIDSRIAHTYLAKRHSGEQAGHRVVLLSSVLPDPINIGYQDLRNMVVTHVNGEQVNSMADVFSIADRDGLVTHVSLLSSDVDIVLDRQTLPEANERLAELYRLPSLRFRRQE
jgi:hypothetical protein